jgi:hypothetical protein
MIEVTFFYPNGDGNGSWSFDLLPSIEAHYDGEANATSIQIGWLFWGFSITRYW